MYHQLDFTHMIEIAVFIFACGMAYRQFKANSAMLKEHTVQLKLLEDRMAKQETEERLNRKDHENITAQLSRIEEKLDPIVAIAILGDSHMKNMDIHVRPN